MSARTRLEPHFTGRGEPITLALAGRSVQLVAAPELLASLPLRTPQSRVPPGPPPLPPAGWSAGARGLVGDHPREVICRVDGDEYHVEVRDLAGYWVAADGGRVQLGSVATDATILQLESAVVGPPLLLALALQSAPCLHAGAVSLEGRVAAFVGPAGAGKSTLTRLLVGHLPEARPTADDVLPWAIGADGAVTALPHFPQPKLPPDRQPWTQVPACMPLAAVFLLPGAGHTVDRITCSRLEPARAVGEWLEHTMAVSLFPPPLLHRHLQECARATVSVPTYELRYPWQRKTEAAVAATVLQHVRAAA